MQNLKGIPQMHRISTNFESQMKHPFHPVIGIVGGGQLGKMLIESAAPWNLSFNVLDPDPEAPCRPYAKKFIQASLTDDKAIRELASVSDVLTFEIEHINTQTLLELEQNGKKIIPSPSILNIIQDKGTQKQFYHDHQLPTAPFTVLGKDEQWEDALDQLEGEKVVAKLCRGGYDGKGVTICTKESLRAGIRPYNEAVVLEQFVPDCREIAILVASDGQNQKVWPSVEMDFDPRLNLVDYICSPGRLDPELEKEAARIAINTVKALKGIGVFAVEMFITRDNRIYINETAPRPHNSGHHTIESSITSQYEQLNRILLGFPLGQTEFLQPAVMVNLIGPEQIHGNYKLSGVEEAMKTGGFYLHLYNKTQTKPGRKMGHFTVMAPQLETAIQRAMEIRKCLKIEAENS